MKPNFNDAQNNDFVRENEIAENHEIIYNDLINTVNENDQVPVGWSSICFNETINFYNNYYIKNKN